MVTHTTIQRYKQNYGTLCITGLFGCKWKRYKQSLSQSSKIDLLWFVVLTLVFCLMVLWMYFWTINLNSFDLINWFFYSKTNSWFPWYILIISVTGVVTFYVLLVMVLACCHACMHHQIYMHTIHRVLLTLICVAAIIMVIVASVLESGFLFNTVFLSLLVFGPFLQIALVFVMTALSWLIVEKWLYLQKWSYKVVWLLVYVSVMVGLYICPMFIKAPCIVDVQQLPRKPLILAHRGASRIAPENTNISFLIAAKKYNVWGLESDVQISLDGVPFLLHDKTLKRTTNIAQVFPDRVDEPAEMFNFTDLRKLDAGSWFEEDNPQGSVPFLSDKQLAMYKGQKILSLIEYVYLAKVLNKTVMFDVRLPESKAHPYYGKALVLTAHHILKTGIDPKQVLWLNKTGDVSHVANFTIVIQGDPKPSFMQLMKNGIGMVNARTDHLSLRDIVMFSKLNISSNMFVVNSDWLFSLYWCMGVHSITTNNCHSLSQMDSPVYNFAPQTYLIIWVICDAVSALLVVIIFIIQRRRSLVQSFQPQLVYHVRRRHVNRSRIMKEKLIHNGDFQSNRHDVDLEEPQELKRRSRSSQNSYARSSYSGSIENRSIVLDDELSQYGLEDVNKQAK